METLRVLQHSFDARMPRKVVVGSVNTERVKFLLDPSWEGLAVFASFLNKQEGQERTIHLDESLECDIPWECCSVAGTLMLGLLGRKEKEVVKPTIWLRYADVVEGVSPDGGVGTQARTPDVLDELLTLQQQAAECAQTAADAIQASAQAAEEASAAAHQAQTAAETAAQAAASGAQGYAEQAQLAQQAAQDAASKASACETAARQAFQTCMEAVQQAQDAAATAQERASQTQDLDVTARLALNYARQNAWVVERGSVQLTNSASYPFNNSTKSVALATVQDVVDYSVTTEVIQATGNVGEIVATDKLANGFKLGYTGSAPSATIKYTVIGGLMK